MTGLVAVAQNVNRQHPKYFQYGDEVADHLYEDMPQSANYQNHSFLAIYPQKALARNFRGHGNQDLRQALYKPIQDLVEGLAICLFRNNYNTLQHLAPYLSPNMVHLDLF